VEFGFDLNFFLFYICIVGWFLMKCKIFVQISKIPMTLDQMSSFLSHASGFMDLLYLKSIINCSMILSSFHSGILLHKCCSSEDIFLIGRINFDFLNLKKYSMHQKNVINLIIDHPMDKDMNINVRTNQSKSKIKISRKMGNTPATKSKSSKSFKTVSQTSSSSMISSPNKETKTK
jgi:hypothetical protein